jgi:hypothetical protein
MRRYTAELENYGLGAERFGLDDETGGFCGCVLAVFSNKGKPTVAS